MSVPVAVCPILCKHAFCVCVCVLAQRSVEERKARSGVLLMLLTAFGVFVVLCEAGSTSWGSPLGPRQSQRRIIHPGTKCVITMRKPGSSSPAAEDCQACWRGGLLLISCGEALNAGAHSPPYTHIQGDTMARTHAAARMLIRTSTHRRARRVAHAQQSCTAFPILDFMYFCHGGAALAGQSAPLVPA